MTDYSAGDGAARLLQLTRGLPAFKVGDTFIHPAHGKMTVAKVKGFSEGMVFGKEIKVHGYWTIMATRDGKSKAEKVSFQVPDLIENPGLAKKGA